MTNYVLILALHLLFLLALLLHDVGELARTADIVPGLAPNLLLSVSKFSDAKYVTVLTPDKLLIFDDLRDLKLIITQEKF